MKLNPAGRPFVIIPLILGAGCVFGAGIGTALSIAFTILAGLFFVFTAFCLYFFRDPSITITAGDKNILSPCNGTVLETNENKDENVIRVFLSIFDVHLQRAPIHGTVTKVEHKSGKFLMAMRAEAHEVNEQNIITMENEYGTFVINQIAGFIARRCISWVKQGDTLAKGDKIGHIRFGSQVDLHIPKNTTISVTKGQKVRSGITILGQINERN
ncbi:phosphatidylserine decarboxylase [Breznakiellaceae bacterium SP9]